MSVIREFPGVYFIAASPGRRSVLVRGGIRSAVAFSFFPRRVGKSFRYGVLKGVKYGRVCFAISPGRRLRGRGATLLPLLSLLKRINLSGTYRRGFCSVIFRCEGPRERNDWVHRTHSQ